MGRLWRVDKTLEGSEGLGWVRKRLGAYDWSKVDWITVRRGRSERYAFRGVCKSPPKGHSRYRINCNVSTHTPYPVTYYIRVSPLYRNPDGAWPEVPEGHKVGDRYVSNRGGKSVQWRRLYRSLKLGSEDEVLVFLVAHEAFHYLRRTRQVEGRHGEIEADAFALRTLRAVPGGIAYRVKRKLVRIELILYTVLNENHKRQVEQVMDTLQEESEGLYKRPPY